MFQIILKVLEFQVVLHSFSSQLQSVCLGGHDSVLICQLLKILDGLQENLEPHDNINV